MVSFFALDRDIDASGVSGTGRVASGISLDSGVLVSWTAVVRTIGWYSTMQQVDAVHGHAGATRLTPLTQDDEQRTVTDVVTELLQPAEITLTEALERFEEGEVTAFGLDRDVEVAGTGTGRLAIIVDLGSGALAYWNDWDTIGWYPNLDTVERIHGHNGGTRLTKLTDVQQRHEAVAPIPTAAARMHTTVTDAQAALITV